MLERMNAALSGLREADQFRDLTTLAGVSLISNDYLGLSGHPQLQQAVVRAIEAGAPMASTGSRLLSGNDSRWEALEAQFAEFLGVEAALYFTSGYAANTGLLASILESGDLVFSDAANHASLIDGMRLSKAQKIVFPHSDLDYLENELRRDAGGGRKVIVVESVFSMEGDRAPLTDLLRLCERFDAFLIVDEAHATAVEGREGCGLVNEAGRSARVLATVHTCGKALASMGAFVAGSRALREFLINCARTFIFSTALPPYCAAQVGAAIQLAREADAQRAHLRALSRSLRERLAAGGFNAGRSESQIVPLILGSNAAAMRTASALAAAGFAVRAIRPPTVPAGTARLRFSLNAGLSMTDVDRLVHALTMQRRRE